MLAFLIGVMHISPGKRKKTGRLSQLDSMCWIWELRRGHTLKKWPGSCSRVGPTQCSAWWWGRWFQNRVKPRSLIGTPKNIDTKQHSENTIQYSSTLLFWISPGYPLNHTRRTHICILFWTYYTYRWTYEYIYNGYIFLYVYNMHAPSRKKKRTQTHSQVTLIPSFTASPSKSLMCRKIRPWFRAACGWSTALSASIQP